jgi:hypothetical protein
MSIYKNSFTALEQEYSNNIRKLQEESSRTGKDMSDEYENTRSNYIIQKTKLEVEILNQVQDRI